MWLNQGSEKCCVLTNAHRLDTINDYEKVVVLERGKVVDEGEMREVYARKGKLFDSVEKAGKEVVIMFQ